VDDPIWITRCTGGTIPGAACYSNSDCPGIPNIVPQGSCQISHVPRYLGGLALFVPEEATGTFTVSLRESPMSNLLDENNRALPLEPGVAFITIRCGQSADCITDDACVDVDCVQERCVATPNYDDLRFCCAPGDGGLCPLATTPGDVDGDGDRDLRDFAALQLCYGAAPIDEACAFSDLMCDCAVDGRDFSHFFQGLTEPSSP
jgi:hypothetical protein